MGVALTSLGEERRHLLDENQELIKQRAQMEFSVKDMEQSVSEDQMNQVRHIHVHVLLLLTHG